LAKIAKPSKSGSFGMAPSETMSFDRFYFWSMSLQWRPVFAIVKRLYPTSTSGFAA
jgi:hypothetical protein